MAIGLVAGALWAADDDQFAQQSLAFRTALHYDASLRPPLEKLVGLYRDAGREEELVALYRTHVTQYPADVGAHVVLVRLLRALNRPEAESMTRLAVERHPEDATIAHLEYEGLVAQRDPEALAALVRAVGLLGDRDARRRDAWLDDLVDAAEEAGRPEAALPLLEGRASDPALRPSDLVATARQLSRLGFAEQALASLERAWAGGGGPELMVEIDLLAADAEAGLGRKDEALARLAGLLDRVAPDYWRRGEIAARRMRIQGGGAGADALLADARSKHEADPANTGAALELVELLAAAGRRREALDVLLAVPTAPAVEAQALALFDRTGDARREVAYLSRRLDETPGRPDLRYRLVKALYATGDKERARAEFAVALQGLTDEEQRAQQLELGRALRRMAFPLDASHYFKAVVVAEPDRIDVRRELAETYLAAGDPRAASALFTAELAAGASLENFADVIQFMIAQGMLAEAQTALVARLADDPTRFEFQLSLVDVLGKMGEQSAGERAIEQARALTDTGVRSAQWLEAAARFHETFDTLEPFFDAEQARYAGEEDSWSADVLARFLVFCEMSDRNHRAEEVAGVIRERLEPGAGTGGDGRVRLRRLLVDVLEGRSDHMPEASAQLEALIGEDAARADIYRIRLARLYHSANRPDLARPLLELVDFPAVGEAEALAGSHGQLIEYGMIPQAVGALARLTELEPATLAFWERYIQVLAATGDEGALRGALRKLIFGGQGGALSDQTYALLRAHLADSYWRSVVDAIDRDDLEEALALLDEVEQVNVINAQRLWALWARIQVLEGLGRDEAREVAAADLREVLAQAGDGGQKAIIFPDGLALEMDAAMGALDRRIGAAEPVESSGPVGGIKLEWAFDTARGRGVTQILPVGAATVLVVSDDGGIAAIDADGGKVRWEIAGTHGLGGHSIAPKRFVRRGAPRTSGRVQQQRRGGLPVGLPDRLAVGNGRIYIPDGDSLTCRSVDDGSVLWRGFVGDLLPPAAGQEAGAYAQLGPPPMGVFVAPGGAVTVFSPGAGVAASFQGESGKVLWMRDAIAEGGGAFAPAALGAGAAFRNGLLCIYGHRPLILDGASGATLWSFDGGDVRAFPLALELASDVVEDGSTWTSITALAPVSLSHLGRNGSLGDYRVRQFVEGRGELVAPAVGWATSAAEGSNVMAALTSRRLLLMGTQGMQSLSLELPLAAQQFPIGGTFVGAAGSKAVVLDSGGRRLQVADLARGGVELLPIGFVGEGREPGDLDVALSGARAYAVGPDGVVCYNVLTGQNLFAAAWPERSWARDLDGGAESPAAAFAAGAAPSQRRPMIAYWQGTARQSDGRSASVCVVPRAVADGGRLYCVTSKGRVVALGDVEK